MYEPTADGILCRQPKRLFNRPLYCANIPSVVMAGDRPVWLLIKESLCLGRLEPRIWFDGRAWSPQHPYRLTTRFKPNRVEHRWGEHGEMRLQLEVFPAAAGTGCWIGMTCPGGAPVALRWTWSGIGVTTGHYGGWNVIDPTAHPSLLRSGLPSFAPREFRVHRGEAEVQALIPNPDYQTIVSETRKSSECAPRLPCRAEPLNEPVTAVLRWAHGRVTTATSQGAVAELRVELSPAQPTAWLWWGEQSCAPQSWEEAQAARAFQVERGRTLRLATPSPELDAAAPHAVTALQGCYYPPFFVHGAMSWNHPYLGWSVFYGGVTQGWADRLQQEFALAFAAQESREAADPLARNDPRAVAAGDGQVLPGPQSHFHGRGRIDFQQWSYNMQEVFFDQVIEAQAHRLLGNLWPKARQALREHLAWEKRCFDPQDTGLFESCINTWASDGVWYSGGPGTIATAYNYRANLALGRAREAARIKRAADERLWLKRKGWYAEYRDFGPDPLVHESACLYSVFLPITCGMADPFQARQLLQYARHELENVTFKDHPGRLCWLSQWVPYQWSVRELGHGETLMLALAAFIAGDAALGWDYLQGVIHDSQYAAPVPGGLQMEGQAAWARVSKCTDFGDPVSLYHWTLSRGLAGFRPVPNGPLRWEPALPEDWSHADLQFPAHGVKFRRHAGADTWTFRQRPGQELELALPLPGSRHVRVRVDGRAVPVNIQCQVGKPRIHLTLRSRPTIEVVVQAAGERPWNQRSRAPSVRTGGAWRHDAPRGCRILEVRDPQEVLADRQHDARSVRGRIIGEPGHRLLFLKLSAGAGAWWQPVELEIKPAAALRPCLVPSRVRGGAVRMHSLESVFNGQIKNLCARECLAPRPPTCGAQIGLDGYSSWTHVLGQQGTPPIDASLWHHGRSRLVVDGIPFLRPRGDRDAVLVSRWNHLPREIVIPLGHTLRRLDLLVAVNTSVMQAQMDVLKLTLSGDSRQWVFPLHHPRDVLSGIHDYDLRHDRSALPRRLPKRVPLGKGLQGCVLQLSLPRPEMIRELKWECTALETIGGLLGVSYR